MAASEEINNILTKQNALLTQKFAELSDDYSTHMIQCHALKAEMNGLKEKNQQFAKALKSTCSLIVELTEMIVGAPKRSQDQKKSAKMTDNYSIEVYDTMTNNEEERKHVIINQVKSMIKSKFTYFENRFKLCLEQEKDRLKSMNNRFSDLSLSNIKYSFKKDIHSCSSEDSKRFRLDFSNSKLHKYSDKFQPSEDLSIITKNNISKSADKPRQNLSESMIEASRSKKKIEKEKKEYSFEHNSFFTHNEMESSGDKKEGNTAIFTNLSFNNDN